jgi:hypothetical protein
MAKIAHQENFNFKKLEHMSVTNVDKANKDSKSSNTKFKAFNFERKSY